MLDAETVAQLRAPVVCGAANNQLASDDMAVRLAERDVLYAPDFLVNAGGIINVAGEYLGWNASEVRQRVTNVGQRLKTTLALAAREGMTPHDAARTIAMNRMTQARRVEAVAA